MGHDFRKDTTQDGSSLSVRGSVSSWGSELGGAGQLRLSLCIGQAFASTSTAAVGMQGSRWPRQGCQRVEEGLDSALGHLCYTHWSGHSEARPDSRGGMWVALSEGRATKCPTFTGPSAEPLTFTANSLPSQGLRQAGLLSPGALGSHQGVKLPYG